MGAVAIATFNAVKLFASASPSARQPYPESGLSAVLPIERIP